MKDNAKRTPSLLLAGLVALPLLASCGLRGSPQRAAPIFTPAPAATAPKPPTVQAPEPRQSTLVRQNVNEFGGEIPDAAPTEEVGSIPLTDPVSPDDE